MICVRTDGGGDVSEGGGACSPPRRVAPPRQPFLVRGVFPGLPNQATEIPGKTTSMPSGSTTPLRLEYHEGPVGQKLQTARPIFGPTTLTALAAVTAVSSCKIPPLEFAGSHPAIQLRGHPSLTGPRVSEFRHSHVPTSPFIRLAKGGQLLATSHEKRARHRRELLGRGSSPEPFFGPRHRPIDLKMNAAPRDLRRTQALERAFRGWLVARDQNRLASARALAHLSDNTRAVPLARKRDAHQGRVFFLAALKDHPYRPQLVSAPRGVPRNADTFFTPCRSCRRKRPRRSLPLFRAYFEWAGNTRLSLSPTSDFLIAR